MPVKVMFRMPVKAALIAGVVASVLHVEPAAAQATPGQWEAGGHVVAVRSGEFDGADTGVGGRLARRLTRFVGAEAELTLYPRDFPDPPAFSRGRIEGLFGVTAGMPPGGWRVFARLRPGFVRMREAPGPLACILIFPPPLGCTLASGRTLLALDLGGGLEIRATRRTFVRFDVGDRLLRYPGPAFDSGGDVRDRSFFGHDFRFAGGVGLRF